MGRLIEVEHVENLHPNLSLQVGDFLLCNATGGRVQAGAEFVEMAGVLSQAVIGDNGSVFSAMGAPNAVLFHALRVGKAVIDLFTGDPWGPHAATTPRITTLRITVDS
jgi:hypothetical protein